MDWKDPKIAEKYKPAEAMTGPFAAYLLDGSDFTRAAKSSQGGSSSLVILDNACGTGVVTAYIYEVLPDGGQNVEVVAADNSAPMIEAVKTRIDESGWKGATAKIADAEKLDFPSSYFTHVFTNFGVTVVPHPRSVLEETYRVLRQGGVHAYTHWESVGWYKYAEQAIASLGSDNPDTAPPAFPSWMEFYKFFAADKTETWYSIDYHINEVSKAGFIDVKKTLHHNTTTYADANEVWKTFEKGLDMIVNNWWNAEQKEKWFPSLQEAMVQLIKEEFGEGEVKLVSSAWVIVARKPDQT